jgi:hypothetical protein
MAKTTVAIDLQAQTKGTESVKSLKTQIREATQEAVALAQKFGEFSPEAQNATKRVAELKDQMEDFQNRVAGVNPDKFSRIATITQGLTRGIQGAAGAMALFGVNADDAQKVLARVQGATAFAEGAQGLIDLDQKMGGFVKKTIEGFRGIRGAVAATGIGLLVVALGTMVAYWDDIKTAIGGVSAEQKKLSEEAKKNLDIEKDKTKSLELSENTLRLQGKTEREIQNLKLNQYNIEIQKGEVVLKNARVQKNLEVEAAKRNKTFAENAVKFTLNVANAGLRVIAAPLDLLIKTANEISEFLGFGKLTTFSINAEITKMIDNVANLTSKFLFNPEETAKEGDKVIKEAENNYKELINKRDGLIVEMRKQDQQAAENANKSAEEMAKNQRLAAIETAQLQAKTLDEKLAAAEMAWQEEIKGEQYKGWTIEQLTVKHDSIMNKIRDDFRAKEKADADKARADREKALQDEYNANIEGLNNYYDQRENVEKQRYLKGEIDFATFTANIEKIEAERNARVLMEQQNYGKDSTELQKAYLDKQVQQKKEADEKQVESEKKKAEDLKNAQRAELELTAQGFAAIGELAETFAGQSEAQQKKAFEIKKKASIAQAIVETLMAAQSAYASQMSIPTPDAPIRATIAAALALASGVARVRKIEQTKFESRNAPAGGGGNNPSAPNTTPVTGGILPDMEQPGGFAGMGRVYVLEGDITKTQTRVRRVRNVSVV